MSETPNSPGDFVARREAEARYEKKLADWITAGLERPGKKAIRLAEALRISRSEVSKMRLAERKVYAYQLFILEDYFEEAAPYPDDIPPAPEDLNGAVTIPILGEAGRPAWYEVDAPLESHGKMAFVPESRFEGVPHIATLVVGDEVNRAFPSGSRAIYVPYWSVRKSLADNDFVLLNLVHKQGMQRRLIRQVKPAAGRKIELATASYSGDQPRPPITLNEDMTLIGDGKVEIVGLVVSGCMPAVA